MSVERICVRQVDVARPDESVQTGAQRMLARKVGTLVVVDRLNQPVGIVTDRDLTVRVLAEGRDPAHTLLADVMTREVTCVSPETSIEDALRLMRAGSFRRVPVTDHSGRLSGLVSLDDILDLLSHEFRDIGRLLVDENPESIVREWKQSDEPSDVASTDITSDDDPGRSEAHADEPQSVPSS
jgi:CBS domain-containing protein